MDGRQLVEKQNKTVLFADRQILLDSIAKRTVSPILLSLCTGSFENFYKSSKVLKNFFCYL